MFNIKIKTKTELDQLKSILRSNGISDLATIASIFIGRVEALTQKSFELWLGECITSCRAYLDEEFAEKQVASILTLPNFMSVYFEKEDFREDMLSRGNYYEIDKTSDILINSEILVYMSGNKPCLDLCYCCRVFVSQKPNGKGRVVRILIS